MKRITELKGIGAGKTAILIGGGYSAGGIDLSKLPKNAVTIALNDSMYFDDGYKIVPNFMIYYDRNMIKVMKKMNIPKSVQIISYNNSMIPGCHFHYRLGDIKKCRMQDNIGKKALVLAKEIMGFDKIFLIGFDFYTKKINGNISSHLQGEKIGIGQKYVNKQHFETHLKRLNKRPGEFEVIKDFENVFNCNPKSALKYYGFLMPY